MWWRMRSEWLYKTAALLFLVAAGLQMFAGNTRAGKVPLWLAAIATLGATVLLVARRLREDATRRETEDKMVKDIQGFLAGPPSDEYHTVAETAQASRKQAPAPEPCDFQELGPAVQSKTPNEHPAVMGAISPKECDPSAKQDEVFEAVGPLPEKPML